MNRLEQLRSLLASRGFEAVVLTKPANFAAFFRGAQVSLGFRQEPPGRIAACVTRDRVVLLGNQTEVSRVAEDELSWLDGLMVKPSRWDKWNLKTSVEAHLDSEGIERVGDDIGAFGENMGMALEAMYYPLSDEEIKYIRELAKDTASIVEAVAKNVAPGITELQVAGELSGQLVSRGIWPEFVMAAGDERISKFRHCVPKNIPIRRLCLLSATAHRRGLYVSLTRLLSLGAAPPEWCQLQKACNRIDAKAILLSKPGASVGEIFRVMRRGYVEEGYPEEWAIHHQGGPAGFYGRDYKATENESRRLIEHQPIVWNPTVRGAKSEDTILATQNGQLPDILTDTGGWVYYDVTVDGAKIQRPMILEK